ncbi:GIY-YIG nuclease family protein [Mycolicibacter sinensis]
MTVPQPAPEPNLTLGHVLSALGGEHDPPIGLAHIRVIRHSYNPQSHDGLRGPDDLTDAVRVREYTRSQDISTRNFPRDPERYWVLFAADGQKRSRLWGTFENHGEVVDERTETGRFFDLRSHGFLTPLKDRLVVEWDVPLRWNRQAANIGRLPVLEIADRDKVPFPGYDKVRLRFPELVDVVSDVGRYGDWHAALREVAGIYLIADASNGKLYVGKADGAERILQRWTAYAGDGHGGNRALRELAAASIGAGGAKTEHARNFVFSLLRVFGPGTPVAEINEAEAHYKAALVTRFGLNRN